MGLNPMITNSVDLATHIDRGCTRGAVPLPISTPVEMPVAVDSDQAILTIALIGGLNAEREAVAQAIRNILDDPDTPKSGALYYDSVSVSTLGDTEVLSHAPMSDIIVAIDCLNDPTTLIADSVTALDIDVVIADNVIPLNLAHAMEEALRALGLIQESPYALHKLPPARTCLKN